MDLKRQMHPWWKIVSEYPSMHASKVMLGSFQMGLQFRLSKFHFNALMDFDLSANKSQHFYGIWPKFYNLQSTI